MPGFEGGARLVKSLQKNPRGIDYLIYPIVMIYRHGVETALKYMAKVLPALCDEPSEGKAKKKPSDWKLVYRTPASVVEVPIAFEFKDVPLP